MARACGAVPALFAFLSPIHQTGRLQLSASAQKPLASVANLGETTIHGLPLLLAFAQRRQITPMLVGQIVALLNISQQQLLHFVVTPFALRAQRINAPAANRPPAQ